MRVGIVRARKADTGYRLIFDIALKAHKRDFMRYIGHKQASV